MIAHVSIPVSDYKRSKEFYLKALEPVGYKLNMDFPPEAAGFMEGGHTSFWISLHDKIEPIHVALIAPSKEKVEEFYKLALAAGGKDNGAPGYREDYGPGYYAAFVLDPDGNNVEAVFYE